jgi:general secretion pathway protein M
MSLRERYERLEERERKLLGILALVAVVGLLLVVPVAVTAALHTQRSDNESLREAIQQVESARPTVEAAREQMRTIEARYASVAPPLAAYLSKLAAEVEMEIPESQDRQPVPHGKRYEERSTKIVLRKVGMLKLSRFMEKIAQSGHPIAITQLAIRKRSIEPDSYDADLSVSAFDRKAEKVPAKSGAGGAPAASARPAGEDEP